MPTRHRRISCIPGLIAAHAPSRRRARATSSGSRSAPPRGRSACWSASRTAGATPTATASRSVQPAATFARPEEPLLPGVFVRARPQHRRRRSRSGARSACRTRPAAGTLRRARPHDPAAGFTSVLAPLLVPGTSLYCALAPASTDIAHWPRLHRASRRSRREPAATGDRAAARASRRGGRCGRGRDADRRAERPPAGAHRPRHARGGGP